MNSMEKMLINIIRRNPNLTKSEIATLSNVSWATVSNTINSLADQGILLVEEKEGGERIDPNPKALYRAKISLNKDYEVYVGVSVGSSNIKIVFLGFDLSTINKLDVEHFGFEKIASMLIRNGFEQCEDGSFQWCVSTPRDIISVSSILIDVCNAIYDWAIDTEFKVGAITFTFPGHIDYSRQQIISTANLCNNNIQQADISRVITSTVKQKFIDKKIDVYIDHNVKSATIAEKTYIANSSIQNDAENMFVMYLGKGVGIGMVLDNRLFRGKNNLAGQLGHIVPQGNDREFEDILWNDVFECKKKNCRFEDFKVDELKNTIRENPAKKEKLVKLLADTIKNIVQIIGVQDIVFAGKFGPLFEEIELDLLTKLEDMGSSGLSLQKSRYGEYSAAVGAAMTCFHRKYEIAFEWEQLF